MTDYAGCWKPQTIDEARFHVAGKIVTDADFWDSGRKSAETVAAFLPGRCNVVIDYGCGVGRVLRYMPGTRRIGVDISAEMLDFARQYVPGGEFVLGDGATIKLEDGCADYVYSLITLQHMDAEDAASIVREVGRILRPGGRCWLQFSAFGAEWAPDATLSRGPCNWIGTTGGNWHPAHGTIAYTQEVAAALLQNAGLTVREAVKQKGNGDDWYWAMKGEKLCTT